MKLLPDPKEPDRLTEAPPVRPQTEQPRRWRFWAALGKKSIDIGIKGKF